MKIKGLQSATLGALVLALLSTFGDWLWANFLTDGAILPGVIHGALVFLVLAAILAWDIGHGRAEERSSGSLLLWSLPLSGLALAGVFYPLAGLLGYLGALLVTWMGMWLITATLQRLARGCAESMGRTLLRALAAALGSGLAFWAISGIWTRPSPAGPDLIRHFYSWAFAFFPGLLALLWEQKRES